jgi:hypothetical protein
MVVQILSALIASDPARAWTRRRTLVRQAHEWTDAILIYEAQDAADAGAVTGLRSRRDPCVAGHRRHAWSDDGSVCLRCEALNTPTGQWRWMHEWRKRA